ncbi:MAG: hypothetical protein LKH07_05135 [Acetobacter peroxydans]|nr:hypothetical protein [Acetobacter peroxydans]
MSKKHDPIIHAAIIQAAATLAASVQQARAIAKTRSTTPIEEVFANALELVEKKFDAHLVKHGEK